MPHPTLSQPAHGACRLLPPGGQAHARSNPSAATGSRSARVSRRRGRHGADCGHLAAGLWRQRAFRHRADRLRADRPGPCAEPEGPGRRGRGGRGRDLPSAARSGRRLPRRQACPIRRFPQAVGSQRPRRRGGGHARPLARLADDDGLCGRQARLRGEAADAFRARGPLDGRRGPPHEARGPGGHAAAVRPALPAGPQADPLRRAGQDRFGTVQLLSQPRAGVRQAGRLRPAAGAGLEPVAGPRPAAAIQPQPRDLPFPLVLGLLGRPDDQPRSAFAGHGVRLHPLEGTQGGDQRRRAVLPRRQLRGARHARRDPRIPGFHHRLPVSRMRGRPRRDGDGRASRSWAPRAPCP